MEPLRIGILGASRIAPAAIVGPVRESGDRLVVVAARDRRRAAAFATEHGVDRSTDSYEAVVSDPEIDIVYNGLPNALHAKWNLAAIEAGKHVLTEKPFASNAAEARKVHDAGLAAGVRVVDAFHYRYHPVMLRMLDLVESGELGDIEHVVASGRMPAPPFDDVRWSAELAGGSLMDIGCYPVHASRSLGAFLGGPPRIAAAKGGERLEAPGVDSWVDVEIDYPNGTTGLLRSSMIHGELDFSLEIAGTKGRARASNFILPLLGNTIEIVTPSKTWRETPGPRPTYSYQWDAVSRHIRTGEPVPTDSADAVEQMAMIDGIYRAAGMQPRAAISTE